MKEPAQTASPDIQLFCDIFNASPIGIAVESLEGQPLFVNPAFCSMLGFSEKELRSKHWVDFSPPEDAQKDWALFQQLRAGSIDHYQLEKRYFRRDGSLVWAQLSISLLKWEPSRFVLAMVENITDKKKAEEARFRQAAVIESSDDAIASATLDGIIVSWNTGAQKIYGYTEAEAIDRPINMLVPPEQPIEENKILETLRAGRRIEHFETVRVTKTGKRINVSLTLSPVKDSSGQIVGCSGIARDITQRRLAEEALHESEERLRLAVQAGKMFAYSWDAATDVIERSGESAEILGVKSDQAATGAAISAMVHPDDKQRLETALSEPNVENPTLQITYRINRPDGAVTWLQRNSRAYFDLQGKLKRIVGMIADVTERKLAEEARFRLAAIVESTDDAIFSKTPEGVIASWNKGAQQIYGYTEAEVVGKPMTILIPPELVEEENKILKKFRAGERIEHYETVRVTKTGKKINVSLTISQIKDSTDATVAISEIARDITERRRAEEALLSSEQRYRLLFEKNVAGVGIASPDGRVLDCNDGWAHILGYQSRDEVRGLLASEFYFNPAERQPLLDELSEKRVLLSRKLQLKRKDGSPVWVLFNGAELHVGKDTTLRQGTMIDISEWKRAEEVLSDMTRKLIEAQEQERARIGRELHDDITQRLAMLAVEIDQVQNDPTEAGKRLQELGCELRGISNDVQALSHDLHSSRLEYLGAVAGMKSWCTEFAERQRMQVEFISDVSSAVPSELGLCLFRVLQEALHNVSKHSGVKRVEIQLRETPGEIHLLVGDAGKGFDVEAVTQERGLGLISMRERVRLVNGTISIHSTPMRGTRVDVRVPLEAKHEAQREAV